MSNLDLLLRICLQLVVILAVCRLVGIVGRRLGQTQVVCDMISGVLLGPSLFGLLLPAVQHWLFPMTASLAGRSGSITILHPSMSILYILAQIGIALYMFLVGLEFDLSILGSQRRNAVVISLTGILIPFMLGGLAALLLFRQSGLFGSGISPLVAGLFLAVALSITAFPVLARILQENGIATTRLGTLAIGAAAIGDAAAWCLLAVLLALANGSPQTALLTIGGTVLYCVFMLMLGRMGFRHFAQQIAEKQHLSLQTLSMVLIVVFLCSWFTTFIGLHQIFGAFIVGVAMPRSHFAAAVRSQLEPLTVGLLLPVFFVYSGLNTQVGLLNTPQLWLFAGLIILLAIFGKAVGCMLAARAMGQSWRLSGALGALMNARGLIELILLNIGLEQHLISPTLFTILVLMAIITTVLTTPLFKAFYPLEKAAVSAEVALEHAANRSA